MFPDTRDARNACPTARSAAEYSQIIGHPASFDDFARDARAEQAASDESGGPRPASDLGTLVATIANLAMPDKIMIAGESSFIAKFGIDDLRNGINMYRHSEAAPVDLKFPTTIGLCGPRRPHRTGNSAICWLIDCD
ncbi:MAG: hypothetical protein ACLUAM_08315 [Bifidobacterium adolescentis]